MRVVFNTTMRRFGGGKSITWGFAHFFIIGFSCRHRAQTKPLTFITAITIWVVAIVLATPDLIRSKTTTIVLNNVTNHSIVLCTPFGQDSDPFTATYTK